MPTVRARLICDAFASFHGVNAFRGALRARLGKGANFARAQ
jgi:hypothetical protein